jgi:hypothetical protein
VRDELLEEDAQAAEDVSAVSKVRAVLLERDEAPRKAREDAAGAGCSGGIREGVGFRLSSALARQRHPREGAVLAELGRGEG